MGEKFDELCDEAMQNFMDHSGRPSLSVTGSLRPHDTLKTISEIIAGKTLAEIKAVHDELLLESYVIDGSNLEGVIKSGLVSVDEIACLVVAACVSEEILGDEIIATQEEVNLNRADIDTSGASDN